MYQTPLFSVDCRGSWLSLPASPLPPSLLPLSSCPCPHLFHHRLSSSSSPRYSPPRFAISVISVVQSCKFYSLSLTTTTLSWLETEAKIDGRRGKNCPQFSAQIALVGCASWWYASSSSSSSACLWSGKAALQFLAFVHRLSLSCVCVDQLNFVFCAGKERRWWP